MTDTSVIAAFAVGFVSFASPCVLPLVPGYLSAVSGVAIGELETTKRRNRWRVLGPALLFSLSFSLMFVALGMTASGFGSLLQDNRTLLNKISGVVIITMGIFFLLAPFITWLNKDWHPINLMQKAGRGSPVLAGVAFAFAWTPCVGPTLGAILAAAATKNNVGNGALLLAFYSAGMAIPFIVSAAAFNTAIGAFGWLRRHYLELTAAAGVVLIIMGVLIYTNEIFRLNIEAQKLLSDLGLNFFQKL